MRLSVAVAVLSYAMPLAALLSGAVAVHVLAMPWRVHTLPTRFYAVPSRRWSELSFAIAVRICSKPSQRSALFGFANALLRLAVPLHIPAWPCRGRSAPRYAPASPFPALPLPCVTSLDPAMPQLCRSTQCSSIATHFPSEHSCAAASRFLESALPLQVLAVLCPCRADLFVTLLCRCVS